VVVSGLPNIHGRSHADLVDEDDHGVRTLDVAGELAQRLRHEARRRPICISPISPSISALGVSAATESTTTMSTAPERTSMSVISRACSPLSGLRDQQLGHVDAQLLGVGRVERVLGVDECGGAALALHLRDDRERERGLARGLRPVDLDDAALGRPPTPRAMSRPSEPVEIVSTS